MTALVINNLPVSKDLDRAAMASTTGGHGHGKCRRKHRHHPGCGHHRPDSGCGKPSSLLLILPPGEITINPVGDAEGLST